MKVRGTERTVFSCLYLTYILHFREVFRNEFKSLFSLFLTPTMKILTTDASLLQWHDSDDDGIKKQQHRLLLLAHSSRCRARHGECKYAHCSATKVLLAHIGLHKDGGTLEDEKGPNESSCCIKYCLDGRRLMNHCAQCRDRECAMCEPARVAAKDEHWEGVKRKLSFTDGKC